MSTTSNMSNASGTSSRSSRSSRSNKAYSPLSTVLPVTLTIIALGIGATLAALFPIAMVALYIGILPLPLLLLWVGRDVEAPIDRILAADAARFRRRA